MKRAVRILPVALGLALVALPAVAQVSGELKRWHPVTLTFDGPSTSEQDAVNPFRDYRLTV